MASSLVHLPLRPAAWVALLVSSAPLPAAVSAPALRPDLEPAIDGALEAATAASHRVRIEGTVLLPGGAPARGAVVVSSAGGSAAAGDDGAFALEIELAPLADSAELTAVANGTEGSLLARRRLEGLRAGPSRHAGTLVLAQSQGCAADWIPTFGGQPGTSDAVYALAVFEHGSGGGPVLYAGGYFTSAGGQAAHRVAKWDGQSWSALGSGMDSTVSALAVWDDGSGAGPALYAGGSFTSAGGEAASRVAKWDGQGWSALGSGMNSSVLALAVWDDGSGAGPALYAGGWFTSAGGQPANRIARWDGQAWSALGTGLDGGVRALEVVEEGPGHPALCAGGDFTTAGGQGASRIARWNGQAWSPLGGGLANSVYALARFDDGTGAALFAGGAFSFFGDGGWVSHVARWDGKGWGPVGGGTSSIVRALTVFDDGSGSGPALYAGGEFVHAGGQPAKCMARWDGLGWSAVADGLNGPAHALVGLEGGTAGSPALYAGGSFNASGEGETVALRVARWDGQDWAGLGSGLDHQVTAMATFDDGAGTGPALYAGGMFKAPGGLDASGIARWDGTGWQALGSGLSTAAYALAVFDDGLGGGPALFVGGTFNQAGGLPANDIARWDGQSWSALGSGISTDGLVIPLYPGVRALAVYDDGTGPALHAGGGFKGAGGKHAQRIARWDGQEWSTLGSGMDDTVHALAVFDDGSAAGPALYAGGDFTTAGGQPASHMARWDGQAWSPLGSGLNGSVFALTVFDDGSGPKLIVGGEFSTAGGTGASRIAVWDGQAWSTLGTGMNTGSVRSLAAFDDGSGPALYAGGDFTAAGGLSANRIARWDGASWSPLGAGVDDTVLALQAFDDGSGAGPSLYAGGEFKVSPGGDSHLARFGCPTIDGVPGCAGNPAVLASPASAAAIGGTLPVSLSSPGVATGLGLLYLGLLGTDAAGCGLLVPGWGELLLGPAPKPSQVGTAPLAAGTAAFALPVPPSPALVGAEVALQGVIVASGPAAAIELSNALLVTVTQ